MSESPTNPESISHPKRPVTAGKYPKIYLPMKFRLLIAGIALIPVVMVLWLSPGRYDLILLALVVAIITASLAHAYQQLVVTRSGFTLRYIPLFRRCIAWGEVTDIRLLPEYDVVHESAGIGLRLAPGTGLVFGNLRRGPALKIQISIKGREKTYVYIFPASHRKVYEAFVAEAHSQITPHQQ